MGGLGAAGDSINELSNAPEERRDAWSIGQQAAGIHPFAANKHRYDPMPKREVGKASAIAKERRRCWDYEHGTVIGWCLIERRLIVIRPFAQFNPEKLQAEDGGGAPRRFPLVCREVVPKHGRSRPIRKAILNDLNPLCCQLDLLEDDAGNIAGGPR